MARPRKHNPSIPPHIDQAKLPIGVYWSGFGKGRWFVRVGSTAPTVAGPGALLSDLHAIMEQRAGGPQRGTVDYYITAFHKHAKFRQLADRTQRDYERQADMIRKHMTPMGIPLSAVLAARLTTTGIQRIVDKIEAEGHPTKANHLLRYLRRVLSHGVRHEGLSHNPAKGVAQATERGQKGMPSLSAYASVMAFCRERGSRKAHTGGSVSPYLHPLLLITSVCRLRGIEAVTLTDAHASDDGILAVRRKGSRDNVTRWTPELREAWITLAAIRASAWERHKRPTPLRPEDRPMFVSERGNALTKSGLDSSWQRMMALAIKDKAIAEGERFTLHGLKHRGITDSADKASGGHRTERMRQHYDHEVPVVEPSRTPEFSTKFSTGQKRGPVTD